MKTLNLEQMTWVWSSPYRGDFEFLQKITATAWYEAGSRYTEFFRGIIPFHHFLDNCLIDHIAN